MKLAFVAVVAAAGVAVAAFAGVLQPSGARSAPTADAASGGLTVLGAGSAKVTPDRASFAFSTVSQGSTAAAALSESSHAVQRVIDALRKTGVAKADLQTADVSISPRMSDRGDEIIGYTASNTVTTIVRRLSDAGAVIDAAVAAGANQVSGPNLLASDHDAAYRSALKSALADARAKAETIASVSGSTLGKITAIVEGGGVTPLPGAAAMTESAVPIEPGTQEIQATVSVRFAFG